MTTPRYFSPIMLSLVSALGACTPDAETRDFHPLSSTTARYGVEWSSWDTGEPYTETMTDTGMMDTGEPELETTPGPELEDTGEPELETTPGPELEDTGEPELETTPGPELEDTGAPELELDEWFPGHCTVVVGLVNGPVETPSLVSDHQERFCSDATGELESAYAHGARAGLKVRGGHPLERDAYCRASADAMGSSAISARLGIVALLEESPGDCMGAEMAEIATEVEVQAQLRSRQNLAATHNGTELAVPLPGHRFSQYMAVGLAAYSSLWEAEAELVTFEIGSDCTSGPGRICGAEAIGREVEFGAAVQQRALGELTLGGESDQIDVSVRTFYTATVESVGCAEGSGSLACSKVGGRATISTVSHCVRITAGDVCEVRSDEMDADCVVDSEQAELLIGRCR